LSPCFYGDSVQIFLGPDMKRQPPPQHGPIAKILSIKDDCQPLSIVKTKSDYPQSSALSARRDEAHPSHGCLWPGRPQSSPMDGFRRPVRRVRLIPCSGLSFVGNQETKRPFLRRNGLFEGLLLSKCLATLSLCLKVQYVYFAMLPCNVLIQTL